MARRRDLVRVVIAAADLRRRPRNFGTIASKPPCVRWLGLSAHRYLYRTAAFLGEFRIERDGFGVGAIVFVNGHKSAAPPRRLYRTVQRVYLGYSGSLLHGARRKRLHVRN